MSSRPFRFSNSLANDGAVKEFLVSEEDWLAYRAGLYLSNITTTEASSLTSGQTANSVDVGTYIDTFYDENAASDPPVTRTRNYTVDVRSVGGGHTNTFRNPVEFPPLCYDDDTIIINVIFDTETAPTGNGFEELQASLTFNTSPAYIVTNVTATPAASNINGNVVTWEKFTNPRLKGQFTATYEISFTQNVGLFQATLDVS